MVEYLRSSKFWSFTEKRKKGETKRNPSGFKGLQGDHVFNKLVSSVSYVLYTSHYKSRDLDAKVSFYAL